MFGLGFVRKIFGRNGNGSAKVNNAITRNAKPLARLGKMIEEACNTRDNGNGCNGRKLCRCREDRLERTSRFPADFAKRMREAQEKANPELTSWPSPPQATPPPQTTPPSLTLAELMRDSHAIAIEKGWWDEDANGDCPCSFADQLANYHAEVSEAWEEYRQHGMEPDRFIYYNQTTRYLLGGEPYEVVDPKPEGIAVELADLLIRVADTCQRYNIPIERAIREKMEYNKTRPHRHGGKKA